MSHFYLREIKENTSPINSFMMKLNLNGYQEDFFILVKQ